MEKETFEKATKEQYRQFEKILTISFEDFPPKSEIELSRRFQSKGLRVKKGESLPPSKKQLNYAWNYIQENLVQEQKTIDYYYRTETYNKRDLYRAIKPVYIKGKLYKKGQFLPKRDK
jgi:hypothetical protein